MINQRINDMLNLLLNKNFYSKYGITNRASYWKIGTSIFNTFDRLSKNLKDVDVSFPLIVYLDEKNKTKQGNNHSYVFKIQNKNVTPCKVRGFVSDSAIHQYRSMITAFGLGVDSKIYLTKKDFCNNNGSINLTANIQKLIEKNNRLNLIIRTIVNAFFSNIEDLRNISYSILIELLIFFNYDFTNLTSNNQIFFWKKSIGKQNKKTKICASLVNDLNEIKKDIYPQGTQATYKQIVECVESHYGKNNFHKFIEDVWTKYKELVNDDKTIKTTENQIDVINKLNELKNARSKFKDNIFNDRKEKGLINNETDLYTDLINENNTQDYLLSRFNESEAAHILEIKTIKDNILKNNDEIEKIKNYACDPNNGLMMNVEYHRTFDRGLWSFDANGNMLVNQDNEHYLFNIKGLRKIKINPKVFNKKMQDYLKKR